MTTKSTKSTTSTTSTTSTSKPAADSAAETMETMASVGQETIKSVIEMSSDAATEGYKNAFAYGKDQMDATNAVYAKWMTMGKENLDAMQASASAAAAGVEAYYGQLVDYNKKATAESMDVLQKSLTAKSPQELVELQLDAANKTLNRVIAQSTKLNKLASDAAEKTFEPVKGRVDSMVDNIVKPFLAA